MSLRKCYLGKKPVGIWDDYDETVSVQWIYYLKSGVGRIIVLAFAPYHGTVLGGPVNGR
jgi:hypothetical protein